MTKVGRNDPCPCGSGKKYKHCCLRKAQEEQRDTVRLRRAGDTLAGKLWQFATQARFISDLKSAFGLFWNNRYQSHDLPYMQQEVKWRFIDWYIHDFRTSERRKTPAELFATQRSGDLEAWEREVLEARINSVLSVYRVVGELDGKTGYLQLEDVLRGEQGPIQHAASLSLSRGDAFWSRLISLRGTYQPVSLSILLSPDMVADLQALMQHHFERYQASYYQATMRDFLKDSGHLFNHYFLDSLSEEVRVDRRATDEEVAHDLARQQDGQIVVGSMDQHYDRWLDTPIAKWGGKSPRVLAQTEEGRRRVALLLDELGKIEERKRLAGQPHYDVDRLRVKLHLTAEEGLMTLGAPVIYKPW